MESARKVGGSVGKPAQATAAMSAGRRGSGLWGAEYQAKGVGRDHHGEAARPEHVKEVGDLLHVGLVLSAGRLSLAK